MFLLMNFLLIVGIICLGTGVELGRVLVCFGGKTVVMGVFFPMGKNSFVTVLGCDCVRYVLMVQENEWVL